MLGFMEVRSLWSDQIPRFLRLAPVIARDWLDVCKAVTPAKLINAWIKLDNLGLQTCHTCSNILYSKQALTVSILVPKLAINK